MRSGTAGCMSPCDRSHACAAARACAHGRQRAAESAGSRTSITCRMPRPPAGSSETSMIPEPTSTSSFCAFGRSSRPTRTGARGSRRRDARCRSARRRRGAARPRARRSPRARGSSRRRSRPARSRRRARCPGAPAATASAISAASAASAEAGSVSTRRSDSAAAPRTAASGPSVDGSSRGTPHSDASTCISSSRAIGAASHVASWAKKPPSTTAWKLSRLAAEAIPIPSQRPASRSASSACSSPIRARPASSDTGSPEPVVVAALAGSSPAASSSGSSPASVSRQPRLPHAHARPARIDRHVPELAAEPLRAAEQLAADDDPRADADLARHVEHVAQPARGPLPQLGERRQVRLVVGGQRERRGRTGARAARRPPRRSFQPRLGATSSAPPAASTSPGSATVAPTGRRPSLWTSSSAVRRQRRRAGPAPYGPRRAGCRARRGCGGARRR